MGVAPAGVSKANTGHHHLIIDSETPPLDAPIPSDPNHIHFGGGQTEVKLDLTPGEHTLQLILADDQHVPHDPPVISAEDQGHGRLSEDGPRPRQASAAEAQGEMHSS